MDVICDFMLLNKYLLFNFNFKSQSLNIIVTYLSSMILIKLNEALAK